MVMGVIAFCCNLLLTGNYIIERSVIIDEPVQNIYPLVANFQNWEKWYPWKEMDTDIILSYQGTMSEPGAKMAWEGPKGQKGYLTLSQKGSDKFILSDLKLVSPKEINQTDEWDFYRIRSSTKVTWRRKGKVSFFSRLWLAFHNPNKFQAAHIELALSNLKKWCETKIQ